MSERRWDIGSKENQQGAWILNERLFEKKACRVQKLLTKEVME
jgi:hypothetical protein